MNGVVAVACSGGRDSIALLHATLRAAGALGLRVAALHVHHGLLPQADAWAAGLEAQCARWADEGCPIAFACTRLDGMPARGESVEAWARRERYAALARMAREVGASLVLLAHHRRDQAETVLLQALRGAGPAGLAAMPRIVVREGIAWARPWLASSDGAIEAYVEAHALAFVTDPSNADPRHARSRLRTQVLPALRAAFPEAEVALAAVARQAHEARAALDELAREDLAAIGATSSDALPLAAWRKLSPARRANALRAWLAGGLGRAVPDTLVRRLLSETHDDAPRRWPLGDGRVLRAWRGALEVVVATGAVAGDARRTTGGRPGAPASEFVEDLAEAPEEGEGLRATNAPAQGETGAPLRLLRCGTHLVPGWEGRLQIFAVSAHGIAPRRLAQAVARAREGGEQFQAHPRGIARSLKKQYQAAGLPTEARIGPLLFDAAGTLLFVPGLGIDARAWGAPGEPQWGLRWIAEGEGEVDGQGAADRPLDSPLVKPRSPSREPACPEGKP